MHQRIGETELVSTSANKPLSRYLWWLSIPLLPFVPLAAVLIWQIAVLPSATVHYPKGGQEDLGYIWNVQDRIYRGRMPPGGVAIDNGFLSPDDGFFMEFSWHSENSRWHCISISPKWPSTHIYLDANGNIDTRKGSGTDTDRLKRCEWDKAEP